MKLNPVWNPGLRSYVIGMRRVGTTVRQQMQTRGSGSSREPRQAEQWAEGSCSMKLDVVILFLLGLFPPLFLCSPSPIYLYIHLFLHPNHGPSPSLPKEKSKWEGKQNSLESELMELRETVASLQSRLQQAELQGVEAQVRWY